MLSLTLEEDKILIKADKNVENKWSTGGKSLLDKIELKNIRIFSYKNVKLLF